MARPLQGLRCIEVACGIGGPFAGKLLADMGADVVKVELPGSGDRTRHIGPFPQDQANPEQSGLFHYLNAGKKSITLDPALPDGLGLLRRLAESADALIVNGDLVDLEELGLTWEQFGAAFPRLVFTTITPFGCTGRMARQRAHDITIAALGGVSTAVGSPGRPPLTPPLQLSEYQAGMAAASATLLALFARQASGRGQHVDISPLDVWVTVHQGTGFTNYVNFGRSRQRAGRRRAEPYPYHFLPASDGLMCLIARDGHQWKRFVELAGVAELADNPRYHDRVAMGLKYPAEVDALLLPWFAQRTRAQIFELCRAAHIPFAPVRHIDEVAHCPQLAARKFFVQLPRRADGFTVRVPGVPYQLSATPAGVGGYAPRLGEHTGSVLAELGYDSERCALLRKVGVI